MKRFWPILATVLGLAFQAVPASAALQYTLNCNTALCTGAGSGNYGTVTLTQSGAVGAETIHVDVSLASGYQFDKNNTQALLWSGLSNATLIVSNLTSGFGANGNNAVGSYAASPFTASGNFEYRILRSNSSGTPTLSFDVTKSSGLLLTDFITNFSGGFYFAALIKGTGDAFYAASNQAGIQVPEPGTLTLSIAGLAGLAGLVMLQRRRKQAQA